MWETIMNIPNAWLALVGALVGGSGLKALEHFLSKEKVENDMATSFRKELRDEVTTLRAELRLAESEGDLWRDKYYKVMDENYALKSRVDRNDNL